MLPETFVCAEDESFVALFVEVRDINRAARRKSELVALKMWTREAVQIIEIVIRVEITIAQEFKGIAVKPPRRI